LKLYRTRAGVVISEGAGYYLLGEVDWDCLINRDDLHTHLHALIALMQPSYTAAALVRAELMSPVGTQEIWAAGVTYLRSLDARVAESHDAGGADFYARVYDADRPEIFFKATPQRVARPGGPMRLRRDSTWDVPEPEFTLYITSSGRIVAYTIGNDLSSRSIEAQNPLYLPQAKTWDLSASLGPCLYVPSTPLPLDTAIELQILRDGSEMFRGATQLNQMKRSFTELANWLFIECSFPTGVFLMTGTCIVPPDDFTLEPGDEIRITVPPIGTLVNTLHA
jgi:2-dehydro-3-deoxy-D-arabinonate dehydratase